MIKLTCKTCKTIFYAFPSQIRKGNGKYCTRDCYYISQHGTTHSKETKLRMSISATGRKQSESAKKKISIANKGNIAWNKGKHPEYLQGKNHPMYGVDRSGKKAPTWKGGIRNNNGYTIIYTPNHPFKDAGKCVRQSRLTVEKVLNRYLTKIEVVHHIDLNPSNDHPSNLYLFPSQSKHKKFHHLLRKNPDIILKSNLSSYF